MMSSKNGIIRVESALIHLKGIKRQFEAYPYHLKDYLSVDQKIKQ